LDGRKKGKEGRGVDQEWEMGGGRREEGGRGKEEGEGRKANKDVRARTKPEKRPSTAPLAMFTTLL